MNLAALIVSGLSLIAVIIIGWRSIRLGARAAKASEDSARASELAAKATEESATASRRAAEATERSVAASERAAALAGQDARCRRIEATLDIVLTMREIFNEQFTAHEHEPSPWVPGLHSPEALARIALMRRLEGSLVPFDDEFDAQSPSRVLLTTYLWTASLLEQAIDALKQLLRTASIA